MFANNPKYVDYDETKNELRLSKLLKNKGWYGLDWDERYPNGGKLEWLFELVDDAGLRQKIQDASDKKIEVSYFEYDWTLNSQAEPGKAPPKTKSSAKSGSGGGPDE